MPGPETQFERGACRASIFYNEIKKEGNTEKIPNVVISRSYLDKNNEWKRTNTFRVNDIPKLIIVATKAYDYLTKRKKKETDSSATSKS